MARVRVSTTNLLFPMIVVLYIMFVHMCMCIYGLGYACCWVVPADPTDGTKNGERSTA